MKRLTTLLLTTALAALLAGHALAQADVLPDDERFDQPVSFSTGHDGEALPEMIAALARSAGLTPIVDQVPDQIIRYDIGDPKPFRQVWDLVLTLNDLRFVLQPNDVVVVGTEASIRPFLQREGERAGTPDTDVEQRFYRVNADPEQVVAILERAIEGLDVDSLPGVRTVVVVGTEAQHERVTDVLAQFDVPQERVQLVQRVYPLNNATAADLAEVLQSSDVVVAGRAAGEDENGDDNGNGATERGFTVVADPRTNSLIVTAPAAVQTSIADLIPQLDQPQQQVNVQVRIQEINRRTANNLGIDLTAAAGNFATNLLGGGLRFVFDAQNAVSGLNIGAVLDTLESQGLSRRVDDSTLTVLNNGNATMRSGGELTVVLPNREDPETITYGVQIDVTPRVASDGRIVMDVRATVSDLVEATPQLVNISDREVVSTVTLQPGQTVLLGGLLQNAFTQTQRGIPVLSAIPIIGNLFSQTEIEDERTELLLVVTADVLD